MHSSRTGTAREAKTRRMGPMVDDREPTCQRQIACEILPEPGREEAGRLARGAVPAGGRMGGLSDRPHGRVCNVTETGRFAPDRSFGRGRAPARANRLDEGLWRIRALRLLCLTPLP